MTKGGARKLWTYLPVGMRRSLAHGLMGLTQPKIDRVSRDRVIDPRVPRIVIGLLSSPSGLGQSARLAAKALSEYGYSVLGFDVSSLFFEVENNIAHGLSDARAHRGPAHAVVVINAHLMPYVLTALGTSFLREKYITGYWAWELPRVPQLWGRGLTAVHDIAVPSEFTACAIGALGADLRISVAPHPVTLQHQPLSPLVTSLPRPQQPFTILSTLSASSGFERKNPIALIRAFRLAFGSRRDRRLKLHVTGTSHYPAAKAAILAARGGSENITTSWNVLDRMRFYEWWGAPDAYASLHRSEGFGLPIAEAMCAGYPVIATGWSGNVDYMTTQNSLLVRYRLTEVADPQGKYSASEGEWAEADVEHAAELLQDLAGDHERQRALAQSARTTISSTLTGDSFCRALIRPE